MTIDRKLYGRAPHNDHFPPIHAMTGYDPKRTCGIVTYIYGDQWPLRAYSSPVVATESNLSTDPAPRLSAPSRDNSAGPDGRQLLLFAGRSLDARASNEDDCEHVSSAAKKLGMPKYTPLYDYLRRKPGPKVEMSFVQIERVIRAMLPNGASRPQWCANEVSSQTRHVQCSAWLDAGYEAFPLPGDRIVFRKRQPFLG